MRKLINLAMLYDDMSMKAGWRVLTISDPVKIVRALDTAICMR